MNYVYAEMWSQKVDDIAFFKYFFYFLQLLITLNEILWVYALWKLLMLDSVAQQQSAVYVRTNSDSNFFYDWINKVADTNTTTIQI